MDSGIKISRQDFLKELEKEKEENQQKSLKRPSVNKFKFQPRIWSFEPSEAPESENKETDTIIREPPCKIYKRAERITSLLSKSKQKYSNLLNNLDSNVSVIDSIQDKILEINEIEQAIKFKGGPKTALQLLPRNMRRRASSHNIKRFPRSLRGLASEQKGKNNQIISKKEVNALIGIGGSGGQQNTSGFQKKGNNTKLFRKKKRRNVFNLNGQDGRLETHIWHAKRFRMGCYGDKKVPMKNNIKCHKSILSQLKKSFLVQDLSFFDCLEAVETDVSGSKFSSDYASSFDLPGENQSKTSIIFTHPLADIPESKTSKLKPLSYNRIRLQGNKTKIILKKLLKNHNASASDLINLSKLTSNRSNRTGKFEIYGPIKRNIDENNMKNRDLKNLVGKIEDDEMADYFEEKIRGVKNQEIQKNKEIKKTVIYISAVQHLQGPFQCFDIIIPREQSQESSIQNLTHKLWVFLIYNNGKPIGIDSQKFIAHETTFNRFFPDDFIGYKSMNNYQMVNVDERFSKWKRTPRSKKVNYILANREFVQSLQPKQDQNQNKISRFSVNQHLIKSCMIGFDIKKLDPSDYLPCRIILYNNGHLKNGARIYLASERSKKFLKMSETPEAKIMREHLTVDKKSNLPLESHQNQILGFLTSTWFSEKFGKFVGLGYILKEFAEKNQELFTDLDFKYQKSLKSGYKPKYKNGCNFIVKNPEAYLTKSSTLYHCNVALFPEES